LSFVYFGSIGLVYFADNYYTAGLTVLSGMTIVLTSFFALQNMLFVSLIVSFYYFHWYPVFILIMTFGCGLLVRRLGFREILFQKYFHWVWYIRNPEGTPAADRNRLRDLFLWPTYIFKNKSAFLRQVFRQNTLVIALHSVPAMFLLGYYFVVNRPSLSLMSNNPIIEYCSLLVGASVVVFVLTSLKPLLFLGQAERYFEYSAAPLSLLFVFYVVKTQSSLNVVFVMFLVQMCLVLINFCYLMLSEFRRAMKPFRGVEEIGLVRFLKDITGKLRILTIPAKYSFGLSYQLNGTGALFYHMFIDGAGKGFRYMEEDLASYNWPRSDLEYFQRKYGINLVVMVKKQVEAAEKRGFSYKLRSNERIFENGEYEVYGLE